MSNKRDNSSPFFSIVIPTYNSDKYIAKTLLSVFRQTFDDYEVIVSDDGSADDTINVVKDIFEKHPDKRTRILINRHEGPGASRNRGIEDSNADWICFLDSDDIWIGEKLQKVFELILEKPYSNLICHNLIRMKGGNKELIEFSRSYNRKVHPFISVYRKNTFTPSSVAVKKEILLKAGMFDETLKSAQDYDLWVRLALLPDIRIEYIEEPLCYFIEREGSISSDIELRLKCLMEINKKYYRQLKHYVRFPTIERMRYAGKWYAWAGVQLMRKKMFGKGIYLFLIGILKWPFRFDWILKIINRIKKG